MKILVRTLKKQTIILRVSMVLILAFTTGITFSQSGFSVDPSSSITINGTSTIHNWESEVTKILGSAEISLVGEKISSIDKLSINIPVSSIKSGKSSMDKNTYEALKENAYPEIKFQLKQIKDDKNGQIKAWGDLTIAGVTKNIEMPVKYSVESGSKIGFKGSVSFNMSEFKINPPTALMGTVKTGDQVTLNFETLFVKR